MNLEQEIKNIKHTQNEIRECARCMRGAFLTLIEALPQLSHTPKFGDEISIIRDCLIHIKEPRKR